MGSTLSSRGRPVGVTDPALLGAVVEAYVGKYGEGWRFEVRDDALEGGGGKALLFVVEPVTVFGFGKGSFSQTRWRFEDQRRE